jgi:hypothetical protein
MATFGAVITLPALLSTGLPERTALVMISVLPFIVLAAGSSEKAVTRRLIFLAIGLILLIGLNELSKLTPKLHEWGL